MIRKKQQRNKQTRSCTIMPAPSDHKMSFKLEWQWMIKQTLGPGKPSPGIPLDPGGPLGPSTPWVEMGIRAHTHRPVDCDSVTTWKLGWRFFTYLFTLDASSWWSCWAMRTCRPQFTLEIKQHSQFNMCQPVADLYPMDFYNVLWLRKHIEIPMLIVDSSV